MIEPGAHTRSTHGALLGACAAGADEGRVGQKMSGEIGRGVEQQRVVFGEVPLHVVAGLIHPVAETEDRLVDAVRVSPRRCPCPRRCATRSAERARNRRSRGSLRSMAGFPRSSHRCRRRCGRLPAAQRRGRYRVRKIRRSRPEFRRSVSASAAGASPWRPAWQISTPSDARGDETAGLQRDAEMTEVGGCVFRDGQ